jgi:phosphohistidine phosphatase SixA
MRQRLFAALAYLFLLNAAHVAVAQTLDVNAAIKAIDANVIFMRHALAPGIGDPDNFKVGDCATQRNLSDEGRAQAREIGTALKAAGLVFDKIYSSAWCRANETAQLLGNGPVETFSGLNSFFQAHAPQGKTLADLRRKLDQLPKDKITLMVTHQVIIQAITANSVSSGGMMVYNTKTKQALPALIAPN